MAAHCVSVGGVKKIAAVVEIMIDNKDRLLVVHLFGVVELAHPHAAQAHFRDPKTAFTQFTLFHTTIGFPAAAVGVNNCRMPGSSRIAPLLCNRRCYFGELS